jgi:hypothetical protein
VVPVYNTSNDVVGELAFTSAVSGTASAQTLSPSSAGLPSGQFLGNSPVFYDISTTVVYSGNILVCLTYPDGSYPLPFFNNPKLYHYDAGTWTDITATVDRTNRKVCGTVTSLSPFAVTFSNDLPSSSSNDPHLIGAMGVQYDFDGQADGKYVLFSTPQFQVNMQLSGDDGPSTRFMTKIGVLFGAENFFFDTDTMSESFRDNLQERLAQVGGKLLSWSPWHVAMELCKEQLVTIKQMHTVDAWLSHADGSPWYYLDVNIALPGCHDEYDGALGQTYKCKYVRGEEEFVWSHTQEEGFRVPTLFTPTGGFQEEAPCFATEDKESTVVGQLSS